MYRSGMPFIKISLINQFVNFYYTSLCIDWATDWEAEESWFNSCLVAKESSVLHNFRPALGPIQWVSAVSSCAWGGWTVGLTTHPHLVVVLGMYGAVHPCLHTSSEWCRGRSVLCGKRKSSSDWPKIKTRKSEMLDKSETSINCHVWLVLSCVMQIEWAGHVAWYFNVLLTVHLSITLVNVQLDALFFYFIIRLL
jgi:hypothetical protein